MYWKLLSKKGKSVVMKNIVFDMSNGGKYLSQDNTVNYFVMFGTINGSLDLKYFSEHRRIYLLLMFVKFVVS